MKMPQEIRTELQDGVLSITIARPEKKNAITSAMYIGLTDALRQAWEDMTVKVVCLSGEGDVFTAGNDLGDFLRNPPKTGDAPVFQFMKAAAFFEKPLVASVDGLAVGIGTTILLHCDFVVATPETKFMLPFVNLGLSPEAASSYLLPLRAGQALASELLLWARPFNADTALRAKIINAFVPRNELASEVSKRCEQICTQPAAAVRATKALLKAPHIKQVEDALLREQQEFLQRLPSPEAKEAFNAFAEKRKPDFSQFS
ncbi:MAG: enoyl-CoA hydratase [Puniceicoccales bacterium]